MQSAYGTASDGAFLPGGCASGGQEDGTWSTGGAALGDISCPEVDPRRPGVGRPEYERNRGHQGGLRLALEISRLVAVQRGQHRRLQRGRDQLVKSGSATDMSTCPAVSR